MFVPGVNHGTGQPLRRHRTRITALVAFVGCLVALSGLTALSDEPTHRLTVDLDAIIDNGPHANALWGVYVRDDASGTVLYERNADRPLMPASNQKLLTAATALLTLGSDFRYSTPLLFTGTEKDGVMRGDLVIVGSGDPTFGSRTNENARPDPFETWAAGLVARGVTKIEGRIIGDDDIIDDELYGDGWDVGHVGRYGFAAAAGGITYRDNVVEVEVAGYRSGRPPRVNDEPAGYLDISNTVRTNSSRWSRRLNVDRPFGSESVNLSGLVSRRFRGSLDIPVNDPTRFALDVFRSRLEAAGITVDASLVDIDDIPGQPRFSSADTVGVVVSDPLGVMLEHVNKESDNLYAELIFRTMAWGGSAKGGERRVKSVLDELGIGHAGLSVRDGSGLSRKDLVSPRTLGDLLHAMRRHPESTAFLSSLARGGEQETTLERRLSRYNVWAKTGSLEFVRSLSGYIQTQDDRMLSFTILVNNYPTSSSRVRLAIDEIVSALANSTG